MLWHAKTSSITLFKALWQQFVEEIDGHDQVSPYLRLYHVHVKLQTLKPQCPTFSVFTFIYLILWIQTTGNRRKHGKYKNSLNRIIGAFSGTWAQKIQTFTKEDLDQDACELFFCLKITALQKLYKIWSFCFSFLRLLFCLALGCRDAL